MPAGPRPRRALDLIARASFLAGLAGLAFAWGVATMKWQIFPHPLLHEALVAWEALDRLESQRLLPNLARFEPGATVPGPVRTLVPDPPGTPPDDLILMTGGFFYRMDLCPRFGCMAWVMDRTGRVLHRWEADPAALFAAADFTGFDGFPDASNFYVQGVALDRRDGALVVTFQGRNLFPYHVGLAKFAANGEVLWKRIDHSHHWPSVAPDGTVLVPAARVARPGERILGMREKPDCRQGAVYEEGLRLLAPDGTLVKEFWMAEVAAASDARALAWTVRDDCDPWHVNGIAVLTEAAAARLPGTAPGDLLVSLRSSSSLVVLDRGDGTIRRILYGPMVAQHSPVVLPDGRLLVLDNLGDPRPGGGSRILRLDPATGAAETVFPRPGRPDGQDFVSAAAGSVRVSADGTRMLVAETLGGRVFEVGIATGRVLWTYDEISDLSPWLARTGTRAEAPFARLQTYGADYLTRAEFARLFGR